MDGARSAVLEDASAREAALDPGRSFIVQAPAGSGKTGLLMQRYLALLGRVEHPEEVLAITFTRKATGELRERVLEALAGAGAGAGGAADAHVQRTRALARRVVERDRAHGWGIAEQPSRLRILTIDALCAWLARQLPLRAGLAGDRHVVDDARPLYREAAALTLGLLDDDQWSAPVAKLLGHLDNDPTRLAAMLVEMLGRRDQWLGFLGTGREPRAALEAALARVVADRIGAVAATLPGALAGELVAVCGYAGSQLAARRPESAGAACANLAALPGDGPRDLVTWQGVRSILLTNSDTWRRRFTIAQGFAPRDPVAAAWKDRASALRDALEGVVHLDRRLGALASLPAPVYAHDQWRVLDSLLEVLRICAGLLKVVFAEHGHVDFIEIAGAAGTALGTDEAPTDLALALDYRIRHLLVDEFQDTSHAQYELIARLVAGWSPDDGRSIFLVGDPMQSIYRFREADVGLYQHAREHGIGPVPLAPLALSSNFRSRPEVVKWVNRWFPGVLAPEDDATAGAVRYRRSAAVRGPGGAASGVQVHLLGPGEAALEALRTVDLARQALGARAQASVAVLVRARSHLAEVVPALREAGLAFRGVDIEALAAVPVVQDLLALASAALHPFDRIAWLGLLRAPWCGLRLADLHALVDGARDRPVAALLADRERVEQLGPDARARLERVAPILLDLARDAGRGALARRVEGAWQALGGPACLDQAGLLAAERFLGLMRSLGDTAARDGELRRRTGELFAESAVAEGGIEVMTVHKAKGLEFDTVILPGLNRTSRAEQRRLLAWTRRAAGPRAGDLLLAPFPALDGKDPPVYEFVRALEAEKSAHETARLLYVGATRARERLHLLACVERDDDGAVKLRNGSLFSLFGQGIEQEVAACAGAGAAPCAPDPAPAPLQRLPGTWRLPAPRPAVLPAVDPALPEPPDAGAVLEFDWASRLVRHVGTVVHAALRALSDDGAAAWTHGRLRARRSAWAAELRALGVDRADLPEALDRVGSALANALEDERARWLLDPAHAHAASELSLAGVVDGRVVRVVIDRTFVDAGVRWIVDYKTGRHEGGSVARFLDREQERYRGQLERYATLVGALHPEPIRLGLYFPVFGGWREWAPR